MAITIDTTIGGASSNSYATLDEANTYLAERHNTSDWIAETDDEVKNQCLVAAVRSLNLVEWIDTKKNTSIDETTGAPKQALAFPRATNVQNATYYIPEAIKHAQIEQALHLYRLNKTASEAPGQNNIKAFSRGSVSITYRDDRIDSGLEDRVLSERAYLTCRHWIATAVSGIKAIR